MYLSAAAGLEVSTLAAACAPMCCWHHALLVLTAGVQSASPHLCLCLPASHLLQGSIMMSAASQGPAALPRVQIVPVLRCGGQEGAAVVLLCTLSGQQQRQPEQLVEEPGGRGSQVAADVAVMLQPVSVWCTLPLLANLQLFAEPIAVQLAAAQPAVPAASAAQAASTAAGNRGRTKAAVAAAISDILGEQQAQQQVQQPVSAVRLSLYLPAACLVAAVPGVLPAGLPKYFAADVRGSSSQLLASMAPRLGSQQPKVGSGQKGGNLGLVACWHCFNT